MAFNPQAATEQFLNNASENRFNIQNGWTNFTNKLVADPQTPMTEGGTSAERYRWWRNPTMLNRVTFVPCNAVGLPSATPNGTTEATSLMNQTDLIGMSQSALRRNNIAQFLIQTTTRKAVPGNPVGGRQIQTLLVNPNNAVFKWAREDEKNVRGGNTAYLAPGQGGTIPSAKGPRGSITLTGHMGMAPERQLKILKDIYGIWDPWAFDSRVKQWALEGTSTPEFLAGAPPRDWSMYLWEMWYPVNYFQKQKYPGMETPMRYMGYCTELSVTQSAEQNSQVDFKWVMEFKVLQRRDGDIEGFATQRVGP